MDKNTNTYDILRKKWKPLLEDTEYSKIPSTYKESVTATLLENQMKSLNETEVPGAQTGGVQNWNPIMMSLVRRMAPKLIAFDIAGVQPMTGPTGLIFAIRARKDDYEGDEILFNEADSAFSGTIAVDSAQAGADPILRTDDGSVEGADDTFGDTSTEVSAVTGYTVGQAVATGTMEEYGQSGGGTFNNVSFSIDKQTVSAKSRALKAEYTTELAQDLQAIHGLDAETELANILSTEIMTEINREMVRTIYIAAKSGARLDTTTSGTIDMSVDTNGRWSVERFKGLLYFIERDANAIAKETRRGKGNFIITSSDVASALVAADILDYTPALDSGGLEVDDTGSTFAGLINGKTKVYIDPYFSSTTNNFYCVGYKGVSPYDAGVFYCPYVPLQLMRAVGEDSFQPKIGFKTRYGMTVNPFVNTPSSGEISGTIYAGINPYYRIAKVTNLM